MTTIYKDELVEITAWREDGQPMIRVNFGTASATIIAERVDKDVAENTIGAIAAHYRTESEWVYRAFRNLGWL